MDRLSEHDTLANVLLASFVNRRDAWVRQGADGGYRTVRGVLSSAQVSQHLAGRMSLHVHALAPGGTCRWAALDIDAHQPGAEPGARLGGALRAHVVHAARALAVALADLADGPVLVEATGGQGLHLWVLFAAPVPAELAVALMDAAKRAAGLEPGVVANAGEGVVVERYPKQVLLGAGELGNSLRLPLGRHPRSGRRSCFLDPCEGRVLDGAEALTRAARPGGGEIARSLADHGHPLAPSAPAPGPSPAPVARRSPGAGGEGRPSRPDAWATYRWACSRLGLSDRTAREPRGEFAPVRCVFPANHAHGDRSGAGSAYLLRRGNDQAYGCFVCCPAIDTLELIRRVDPARSFEEVLDVAHEVDPVNCPDARERRAAWRARASRTEEPAPERRFAASVKSSATNRPPTTS